ncbi:MAG: hypothetical protein ABDI20_05010 [Candidatus Bipolaricaulaceae bacterium]
MSGVKWFRKTLLFVWAHPRVLGPWLLYFLFSLLGELVERPTAASSAAKILLDGAGLFLLLPWLSATTLFALEAAEAAQPLPLDEAARRGLQRTLPLVGLNLVIFLVVLVFLGPALAMYLAFRRTLVPVMVAGFILLGVLFVFLWVRLALAEAALVWTQTPISQALGTSWAYTRRAFFPVLGVLLLAGGLPEGLGLLLGHVPVLGPLFSAAGSTAGALLATVGLGYAYWDLDRLAKTASGAPPFE